MTWKKPLHLIYNKGTSNCFVFAKHCATYNWHRVKKMNLPALRRKLQAIVLETKPIKAFLKKKEFASPYNKTKSETYGS